MKPLFAILAFFLITGTAQAATYQQELDALTRTLPRPVRDFIDRRANCNHWMGEVAYDAARRVEITRAYTRLRCGALAADEAQLKRRYIGNRVIWRALEHSRDWLAG